MIEPSYGAICHEIIHPYIIYRQFMSLISLKKKKHIKTLKEHICNYLTSLKLNS